MKPSELMLDFGRPIAYYPGLAKKVGGVKAAVFFCQIFYWAGKQSGSTEDWIYKESDEIENETGLSYEEQKTARKQLVERGLLSEINDRLHHKIGFAIDRATLDSLFPEDGKASSGDGEKPSPLKGTIETTVKNTLSAKKPIDPLEEKGTKTKTFSEQQKMVGALAKVMNGNASLMGSRLGRFAAAMIKAGATHEKVLEMYGPHSWWYKSYWKGHDKGQYPNEADIRNTWDHWDAPAAQKGITMDDILKEGLR